MYKNKLIEKINILVQWHNLQVELNFFCIDCYWTHLKNPKLAFEIILIYDDNELDDLEHIKNLVNKDDRIKLLINKTKA